MVLNYIKRLMGRSTGREDYENVTFQIQKQILKRRYAEGKQNEFYRKQSKFRRPVVCYDNLTSKGTKNVILFKKEKLKKFN
jgi:hypothetical protein|tara:strand:- start:85 stop:327 length:243 start_codon:yes stop_codon:yes gene_type:complete